LGDYGVIELIDSFNNLRSKVEALLTSPAYRVEAQLGQARATIASDEELSFVLNGAACQSLAGGAFLSPPVINVVLTSPDARINEELIVSSYSDKELWASGYISFDSALSLLPVGSSLKTQGKAHFGIDSVEKEWSVFLSASEIDVSSLNGEEKGNGLFIPRAFIWDLFWNGAPRRDSSLVYQPRPKSKKKDAWNSALIHIKAWKVEYVQRKLQKQLQLIADENAVVVKWRTYETSSGKTAVGLEISGPAKNVQKAKEDVETLLKGIKANMKLTIPIYGQAHFLRVLNACRVLEKEYEMILIVDEEGDVSEVGSGTKVGIQVVSEEMDKCEFAKRRLATVPQDLVEKKTKLTKQQVEAFKSMRQEKPKEVEEFKTRHQLLTLKVWRQKLYIKCRNQAEFDAAEAELDAMFPRRDSLTSHTTSDGIVSPTLDEKDSQFSWNPESKVSEQTSDPASGREDVAVLDEENDKEDDHEIEITRETDPSIILDLSPDLPDFWDKTPVSVNSVCVILAEDSDEFQFAKQHLDFSAHVTSVERIQNKALWRKFSQSKSGAGESAMRWCGTMSTNPEAFYDTTVGLTEDPNLEFWKKASFSGVFAFSTANGSKKLLLCETWASSQSKMVLKKTVAYPTYLVTYK
jgi:hypothetical protein